MTIFTINKCDDEGGTEVSVFTSPEKAALAFDTMWIQFFERLVLETHEENDEGVFIITDTKSRGA